MATLHNDGTSACYADFTPIHATLNNLPNGAGTIAALVKSTASSGASTFDIAGLHPASPFTNFYHVLFAKIDDSNPFSHLLDDAGLAVSQESPEWTGAHGKWYVMAVTWAAGTVTERFHRIDADLGGSWTHANAGGTNGGNRAGPGTTGHWLIGYNGEQSGVCDIALVAAWVGIALTDAQCTELYNQKRTSDWFNNSAGPPNLLVECNTLNPSDIGITPSPMSGNAMALTGASPTWEFNGRGQVTYGGSRLRGRGMNSDPRSNAEST